MKFIAAFSLFVSAALATTVSYDPTYDQSAGLLSSTACSDGPNGLITKGYTTFGSLPPFPYIGGSSDVVSWNSPFCGSCYAVTYSGNTIYVLAVDHTQSGINMSLEAMNNLTNNEAQFLGRIDAIVTLFSLQSSFGHF